MSICPPARVSLANLSISGAWADFVQSRFDVSSGATPFENAHQRTRLAALELEVLHEQILLAKQLYNKVTGACRLPPEILDVIFLYLRDTWGPKGVTAKNTTPDRRHVTERFRTVYSWGWMVVIHVCSHWRQVRTSNNILCVVYVL